SFGPARPAGTSHTTKVVRSGVTRLTPPGCSVAPQRGRGRRPGLPANGARPRGRTARRRAGSRAGHLSFLAGVAVVRRRRRELTHHAPQVGDRGACRGGTPKRPRTGRAPVLVSRAVLRGLRGVRGVVAVTPTRIGVFF